MKKQILIITGPTGVGKTDLVLEFATCVPSEIINIDVGQFYKPFAIGTAKPLLRPLGFEGQALQVNGVPHHLFDILDTPRSLTVHEYRNIVLKKIEEVWEKNNLPILVGGSGFYIQSLFFPTADLSLDTFSLRENTRDEREEGDIWDKLYEIDPKRAQEINKNDAYRIQRALQIWQKTGNKPSEYLPQFTAPCDFTFVVLDRERDDLYNRINQRVIEMFNDGWIDEAKKIKGTEWEEFLKVKKLIGYDDILNFLDSQDGDRDILIEIIQQKTRKYSKRQLTFLRMLNSKILNNLPVNCKLVWANLTLLRDMNTLFASFNPFDSLTLAQDEREP